MMKIEANQGIKKNKQYFVRENSTLNKLIMALDNMVSI